MLSLAKTKSMSFTWSAKYSLTSPQNPLVSVMFPVKPPCSFPPVSDYSLDRQLLAKQKEIQSRFHSVFPHFFNSLKSLIFFCFVLFLFGFFFLLVCLLVFLYITTHGMWHFIRNEKVSRKAHGHQDKHHRTGFTFTEGEGLGGWGGALQREGVRGEEKRVWGWEEGVFKSINNLGKSQGELPLGLQRGWGGGVTYIHTYHRYIIGIIWHRKASKPTER